MTTVGISEARNRFSDLVDRAAAGKRSSSHVAVSMSHA